MKQNASECVYFGGSGPNPQINTLARILFWAKRLPSERDRPGATRVNAASSVRRYSWHGFCFVPEWFLSHNGFDSK